MAHAIRRTFELDPPATVSGGTVRAIQDEIASSWGVLEVSLRGDLTSDALVGLQIEVLVGATDGAQGGNLARKAILQAILSAGLSRRSLSDLGVGPRGRPLRLAWIMLPILVQHLPRDRSASTSVRCRWLDGWV